MKHNWIKGIIIALLCMAITACGTASKGSKDTDSDKTVKQRVVKTVMGDISIPTDPKRVIGLSVVYPEFIYALGIVPIAEQNYHTDFPSYLAEPFKNTIKMGIAKTPNFEAILAATPDLIIAPEWWSKKDYDQLSAIAPTVLLPQHDDWRDELRDIGEVFGKKDQAEKVITDLQTKVTESKKTLDDLVGDETVMYMRVMAKEVIIHGIKSDRGNLIHVQLGLQPVPKIAETENTLSISLEVIPEYNPDHLIVQLDDESDEVKNRFEEMMNSSLWKNLTAVKEKHIYMMGGKEWFNLGMSPLANSFAIDAVLEAFKNNKKG
ncbi:ABC transporter substrate-binding protein [Paenibacillus psychroresistens]|uniref:ABC transporter substrate-binding protein n=1 Tax=Paenibacillus psychroresistens TaxID=1778678 RepID=A0A6B8RHF5_9BACL|nr:ABC transporter substrate-binding protein [Paenibacillus psychroresistens]QGQ95911.1 ABC transporter substrate-binding protein [Paenibacillus psychroresistens]